MGDNFENTAVEAGKPACSRALTVSTCPMSSGWGPTRHTSVNGGGVLARSTAKKLHVSGRVLQPRTFFLQPRDGATFPAGHGVYAREREAATTRPATLSTSGRNARWDMSRDQHMRGGGVVGWRDTCRSFVTAWTGSRDASCRSAKMTPHFPRKSDGMFRANSMEEQLRTPARNGLVRGTTRHLWVSKYSLTVLFLDTILSSFLAIRTSSSSRVIVAFTPCGGEACGQEN